jgi:acyl-CoA thioester hydrolase
MKDFHVSHQYHYIVQPKDLDSLNHVNNVIYLQWVQEAAIRHWEELTKDTDFSQHIWVVSRHEIDYVRQTFLGDEILIKTWVGHTEGSLSIRHVEMYRDNKLICKTQTHWRLLNAKTFKPTNIPIEIMELLTL